MAKKSNTITVNDKPIVVIQGQDKQSYICLTDLIKAYEPDPVRTEIIIQNWLRLKDTIEYIGTWETLNNPEFNHVEFDVIKQSSGTNRFVLTAKEWCARTGAVGLISKAGRYGGTYAHKDIAYNFGMWLSPVFYLLVVKEIQRLDTASINELLVLSNLESYNAEMIRQGKNRQERFELLMEMRTQQLKVLQQANADFNFKKLSGNDPKLIEW